MFDAPVRPRRPARAHMSVRADDSRGGVRGLLSDRKSVAGNIHRSVYHDGHRAGAVIYGGEIPRTPQAGTRTGKERGRVVMAPRLWEAFICGVRELLVEVRRSLFSPWAFVL